MDIPHRLIYQALGERLLSSFGLRKTLICEYCINCFSEIILGELRRKPYNIIICECSTNQIEYVEPFVSLYDRITIIPVSTEDLNFAFKYYSICHLKFEHLIAKVKEDIICRELNFCILNNV